MRCKSTPLTASPGAELGLCGPWGQKEAASPPAGLGRASFSCCCGCGAGGSWAVPRCPAQLRASGRGVLLAVTAPGRSGSWSLQALRQGGTLSLPALCPHRHRAGRVPRRAALFRCPFPLLVPRPKVFRPLSPSLAPAAPSAAAARGRLPAARCRLRRRPAAGARCGRGQAAGCGRPPPACRARWFGPALHAPPRSGSTCAAEGSRGRAAGGCGGGRREAAHLGCSPAPRQPRHVLRLPRAGRGQQLPHVLLQRQDGKAPAFVPAPRPGSPRRGGEGGG